MYKNNLNNSYLDWAETMAYAYVRPFLQLNENELDYIKANSFFLTMTFDRKKIEHRKLETGIASLTDTSVQSTNLWMLYIEAIKKLLGKKYNRQRLRSQQPLVIAFFDVEESKYKSLIAANDIKGLHIHALVVLPKQHTEAFYKWTTNYVTRITVLNELEIDGLNVERFDENKGTLRGLVSYSSKFARKSSSTGIDISDLMIFPEHLHDHRPVRHVWRKRNYGLEKMQRNSRDEKRRLYALSQP